jgi:hypothetical protein
VSKFSIIDKEKRRWDSEVQFEFRIQQSCWSMSD